MCRRLLALSAGGLLLASCLGAGTDASPPSGAGPATRPATQTPASTPTATPEAVLVVPAPPTATPSGIVPPTPWPSPTVSPASSPAAPLAPLPPPASTPAATPEAVSVVAATPAPTPAATGTPDVPPTATASPATSSSPPPASRWAVNAADLPTFVFLGDVPEAQQEEVRKRTADIVGFFDELYGIHVPGLTLYFSETVPLLQGATEEVLGVSRTVACGEYSDGSMFVASRCAERAIEHEYFHAIQHHLAPTTTWGPWWLQEGAAEFASILFRDATGRESYDDAIDFIRWALSYSLIELEDLDVVQGVFVSDSLHQISTLAASHLASDASEQSFVDYYSSLSDSVSWRDTFHTTFGITVPDFYSSFSSYRSDVVVVRHAVRGAIVGPDGEPVHRWRIDIEAFPVGSNRHGDLRVDSSSEGLDGTFTSELPDGTYELSLATRCISNPPNEA